MKGFATLARFAYLYHETTYFNLNQRGFNIGLAFILNVRYCSIVGELASQLLCQFGTDETEEQCEESMCPEILEAAGLEDIPLVSDPLCALVCEE